MALARPEALMGGLSKKLSVLLTPRKLATAVRTRVNAMRLVRQTVNALVAPPPTAFAAFGAGSVLVPPARVHNPDCIHVGRDVVLLEHSWLAVERRPGRPAPVLRLGDGTRMNRFVKIECHEAITLGRGVLVADRVYIGDLDPVAAPTADAPADGPRPIVIGDNVFLGVGSIVKPGVTIGAGAYVSAGSIVSTDVPERTLVAGAPARAIRQWDGTEQPIT